MKLLLDGRSINRTGIGTYTKMLVYGLSKTNIELLLMGNKKEINSYDKSLKIINVSNSIYSLKEQFSTFFGEILSKGVDIVHYTNYNKSIFSIYPFVVTIHDLIQFKFDYGNNVKRKIAKILLEQVLNSANSIICVSKSTADDLVEIFPYFDRNKVKVVYNPAINPLVKKVSYVDVKSKYGIPRYILTVGNRKPHKNLGLVVKSFEIVSKVFPDLYLVLIAKRFEKNDYLDKILSNVSIPDRVLVFENLNYDEVISFYKNADITVLPSLYEGFGLVPFESIQNDTLPLVSDIKVMRELFFDESEIFFDPYDPVSLAEKLEKFLTSHYERERVLKNLKKYLEIYSFENFIQGTIEVYKSCL